MLDCMITQESKTIGVADYLADMELSIQRSKSGASNEKRKGMMVYLDKNTPVLVQYADNKSFQKAKAVSKRAGSSSCLRNVIDAGGRLR